MKAIVSFALTCLFSLSAQANAATEATEHVEGDEQACKLLEARVDAARLECVTEPALVELHEQVRTSEPIQRMNAVFAEMDRLRCDQHDNCPQGNHTHFMTPECEKLMYESIDAARAAKALPAAQEIAAHPAAKAYQAALDEYSACLAALNR